MTGQPENMNMVINTMKLRPPSRKGQLVNRPQLLQRLLGSQRCRLSLIQAPAGFGKTSLLTQLHQRLREDRVYCIWLSLDASDNDYSRFLHYLYTAVQSVGIKLDKSLVETLPSGHSPAPATVSDLLTNGAAVHNRDLVICMDDYHLLTHASIEQFMLNLLQSPDSNISWAIATRHTPTRLPLGRLRLLDNLVEITAKDLQFDRRESEEFFKHTARLELGSDMVDVLNRHTEGWVTGLQMASLSLSGNADPSGFIRRFSGAHRNVADFLQDEVLAGLDEDICDFLLDTSVLARINTELCNYITRRTDAREKLDYLESSNLFIFSLDEERSWYRYHHLFIDLLNKRLREKDPDRVRLLHERASLWLEENDYPVEAVEHALKAGDYMRSARLLDKLNLFTRGQIGIIEHYARQIPDEVLEQFPNLQLERIWEWESDWNFYKSRSALARVGKTLEQWTAGGKPVPEHVDIEYIRAKLAHREMMVYWIADDMDKTERLCEEWFNARYNADRYMELSASGALMYAKREHYRCKDTALTMSEMHNIYEEHKYHFGKVFQYTVSGMTLFMQGDIGEARKLYERALNLAVTMHGRLSLLATLPALLLAECQYEQNDMDEARILISDYLDIANSLGYVDKLIAGYITKAKMEFIDGRFGYEAARRTLDDGDRCASQTGFERLHINIVAERIRQLLLHGDRDELFFLARREKLLGSCLNLMPVEGVTTKHELLALGWARIAAARGDLDGAIRLLNKWYQFTLERNCRRSAIRISVDLARLLYQRNNMNAACGTIIDSLRLGNGLFIRSFLDGGEIIREILATALARKCSLPKAEMEYAGLLLETFDREEPPRLAKVEEKQAWNPDNLLLDFNRRELDILELAADDMPNREIARSLALSENTVKWYWKGIFTKLGVHRRLQAVNVARSAGIIF